MMHIKSDLLLQLRLRRGWTQEETAEKIGIDARTYRRYERGEIAVTHRAGQFEIIRCIAKVFDLAGPAEIIENETVAPISSTISERPRKNSPFHASTSGRHVDVYPPDAPFHIDWYVHREPEENEALNKLRTAGAPVVLQGPHLIGKGYLLTYLVEQATEWKLWGPGPCTVIRINVASLERESLGSLDSLLRSLSRLALEQLDAESTEQCLQEIWARPGSVKTKISKLFKNEILSRSSVLLVLEKVERLQNCSFHDDFFALLRGWAESGNMEPWSKLRLLLTIATEPTLLDSIDHSSFFALANPIRLGHLTREQTERMATMYGISSRSAALDQLETLTNGHPYLVRLALYQAAVREVGIEQILSSAHDTGVFAYHLKSLHHWLDKQQLLPMLTCIIRNNTHQLSFKDYCRLYSHGFIIEDSACAYRIRCPLYTQYFESLLQIS